MTDKIIQKRRFAPANKIIAAACVFAFAFFFPAIRDAAAQTPSPSPTPAADSPDLIGGYELTSSMEFGLRHVEASGSENKFRSDFNYRSGFRVFDTSVLIEDKQERRKFFDSLLVNSSGWGADPSGFLRVDLEKTGAYRLDSKVRRVVYFNNLNNHALNQHNANTRHNFGDFDLTVFPESKNLRLRFGYGFNKTDGAGGFTTRAYSDEFPVSSDTDNGSFDLRAGIDGRVLGFNLTLSQNYRSFKNDTSYFLIAPNLGNNPTNNPRLATFQRNYPIEGTTNATLFSIQRTFAKRLDFTGRFVYSGTETSFDLLETITGRDNSNNTVILDRFEISGYAKRPQGRGDIGLTFLVTNNFRISNTFTFDRFNISGGNEFFESLARRNAAGNPLATVLTRTLAHRATGFRRIINTIEADYQIRDFIGFNIGYRFSDRRVVLEGFDRNLLTTANPTLIEEEFDNRTNTLIAGTKIKPAKNWTIYADLEHGEADNVFTRLSNYKFTNLRLRSRLSIKEFSLNLSAITKDNDNPAQSIEGAPPRDFTANIKNRIYSAAFDWAPDPRFSLSTGYTFHDLTSQTDIIVPVGGVLTQGTSQFYMRDNYAFFDISAQPVKRVSVFASYRFNKDNGQGDRFSALPQNIITSYPFKLDSPEVRLAIRLNDNIDWNFGYQYFNYKERLGINQNYSAHLPYTSLRIYFGGADR